LKPYLGNRKTYSEICYIFGPNSFFQILFVPLESTHFKAPNGSENGKWIKMDLTRSSLGHFKYETSITLNIIKTVYLPYFTLCYTAPNNILFMYGETVKSALTREPCGLKPSESAPILQHDIRPSPDFLAKILGVRTHQFLYNTQFYFSISSLLGCCCLLKHEVLCFPR
jgi:hypothetical protein